MKNESNKIDGLINLCLEEMRKVKSSSDYIAPKFLLYDDIKDFSGNYSDSILCFQSESQINTEYEYVENSKDRCESMLSENKKFKYEY